MSIEFRCPTCQKLLRTKDDTAGKQAKCPECGTIVDIPAVGSGAPLTESLGEPASGPYSPPPQDRLENPYQSPVSVVGPTGAVIVEPISPGTLDITDVYTRTWRIFKREMGICIGVVMTAYVLNLGVSFAIQGILALINTRLEAPELAIVLAHQVIAGVFGIWLISGQFNFLLRLARGQDAPFSLLFSGGKWLLPLTGAYLLYLLVVVVGFLLLIVPGVILGLMFSQFWFLIVDRDMGVLEAFKTSRAITSGNKLMLFVLYLTIFPLSLAGLCTCGIGLIFIIPFIALLFTVSYLIMSGQRTADQITPPSFEVRV